MKTITYLYTQVDIKIRRTYGGCNYTAVVYRMDKGAPVCVGRRAACTAAHKGVQCEAWALAAADIKAKHPRRWKAYLAAIPQYERERGYTDRHFEDYYRRDAAEKAGILFCAI